MASPELINENAIASWNGRFEVHCSLTSMDPDNVLSVVVPANWPGTTTVSQLLTYIFPPDDTEQRAVASMLDLRTNPDLPDIYAVFSDAFDEWRKGQCTLTFSNGDGLNLDMSDLVSQQLEHSHNGAVHRPWGPSPFQRCDDQFIKRYPRTGVPEMATYAKQLPYPSLQIHIKQRYHAIEFALQTDFWESKDKLLAWLQSLTFLYFLDKHEVAIPAPIPRGYGKGLTDTAADLRSRDLITECLNDGSPNTQTFSITEEGRGLISRLLSETESYIDLYNHFKDTSFNLYDDTPNEHVLDPSTVAFDTGRGVDLRVQVFESEELDPIRTVFLLRLYDGTLDDYVSTWQGLLDDEVFFDAILEPVVNRCEVNEASIGQILESGYVYLEERVERARELASQQEIIRTVWA